MNFGDFFFEDFVTLKNFGERRKKVQKNPFKVLLSHTCLLLVHMLCINH